MTEIPRHKLHARERADFLAIARVAVLPAEGDRLVVDPKHPGIADGGTGDVVSQVFQRAGAIARGLDVNAPALAPDLGIHLPVVDAEEVAQMLAEGSLKERQVNEKLGLFDTHKATAFVQAGAGDETVKVWMKPQLLVPCVEHRGCRWKAQ